MAANQVLAFDQYRRHADTDGFLDQTNRTVLWRHLRRVIELHCANREIAPLACYRA
jgi:hypothetical protein